MTEGGHVSAALHEGFLDVAKVVGGEQRGLRDGTSFGDGRLPIRCLAYRICGVEVELLGKVGVALVLGRYRH